MVTADETRSLLAPLGVWCNLDRLAGRDVLAFAGPSSASASGRCGTTSHRAGSRSRVLGALARATSRITLGLGVASTYARDAVAAHAGARTIAELSGGRFVMGIGVSHRSSAAARGHAYGPPLTTMSAYLDAYEAAPWTSVAVDDPGLVVAALGPRMLGLAATRAAGAFPYLVPVSYVAGARRVVDAAAASAGRTDRPVLVVSQPVILGSGPDVRAAARASVTRYLGQPNYRANLLRCGFSEAEIDGVADRLIDELVATGDAAALRARVAAMHAAGADHVAVIPLGRDGSQGDLDTARALAPG